MVEWLLWFSVHCHRPYHAPKGMAQVTVSSTSVDDFDVQGNWIWVGNGEHKRGQSLIVIDAVGHLAHDPPDDSCQGGKEGPG